MKTSHCYSLPSIWQTGNCSGTIVRHTAEARMRSAGGVHHHKKMYLLAREIFNIWVFQAHILKIHPLKCQYSCLYLNFMVEEDE